MPLLANDTDGAVTRKRLEDMGSTRREGNYCCRYGRCNSPNSSTTFWCG
jgi:hypothetical protein